MGSHMWHDRCPHCGFDGMVVWSYNQVYLEAACPMCGYEISPDERIPSGGDLELIKEALVGMNASDKKRVVESWWNDRVPLVVKLKTQT